MLKGIIVGLIAKDELSEVLRVLFKAEKYDTDLLLISARYHRLEVNKAANLLSYKDYDVIRNCIVLSLIKYTQEFSTE